MRFVSIFMIVLMLSMPFAFAQEITIVKYSGADNVEGFAKQNDNVTIEVLASLFGQPVNESNIRLYHGAGFQFFDNCVSDAGSFYRCTYENPITWVGSFDFTATLMDNSIPPQRVDNDSRVLIIDDLDPMVNLSSNVRQTKDSARLTYNARDFGLTSASPINCSGIKKITFTKDGTEFAAEFGAIKECTKQGQFEHNFGQAGVEQDLVICAVAEDQLGHESLPACVDLLVDTIGPNITDFGVFNGTGALSHVKPGATVDARIIVSVDDLSDVEYVKGNFEDLTQDSSYYGFVDAVFVGGNTYVWNDVPVSEVSPCQATIKAKDILGNEVEKTFDCEIKADSTPPEFISASTGKDANGTILIGSNSTLVIEFNEKDDAGNAGAGMSLGNAFLDLRQLGLSANVKADYCEKNGVWKCYWDIEPSSPAGFYSIKLTTNTADDLGNAISEVAIGVLFDNQPPIAPTIETFDIVTTDPQRALPAHYDTVVYVVRSGDFSEAVANFSMIGGGSAVQPLACAPIPNTNYADCTFEAMIDVSGPLDASVEFIFSDEAGNTNSIGHSFEIYELMDDPNPNYWDHVVKCTPEFEGNENIARVDRKIASQVGQLLSCNVELRAYDIHTELTSVTGPQGITDCIVTNPTYIGSISLLNARPSDTKPYLLVSTQARDVDVDMINVSCPVYITSKREGKLIKNPESENVEFSIKFYNEPLGDAYQNLEDEIMDQFDTISDFEWVGDLREWMHYAEVGCNLKNTLANVLGIAQQIVAMTGAADDAMCTAAPILCPVRPTPTFSQTCGSVEEMQDSYETDVATFLDGLCGLLNCQAATGKEWVDWLDWAGGGVPWCTGWDAQWKDWMGLDDTRTGQSPSELGYGGTSLNVLPIQDSLIGSSICLCLPGFIRNVEKLRQLECKRALCLGEEYAVQGFGVSLCDAEYDYALCNFIVGDIFSVIPFSNLFDQFADLITEWFADPFSIVLTAFGTGCKMACYQPTSTFHTACSALRLTSIIGESVGSIIGIVEASDDFGKRVDNIYCEQAEEMMEDWEYEE